MKHSEIQPPVLAHHQPLLGRGKSLSFGLGNLDAFAWVGGFSSASNTPDLDSSKKLKFLWLFRGDKDCLINISQRVYSDLKEGSLPQAQQIRADAVLATSFRLRLHARQNVERRTRLELGRELTSLPHLDASSKLDLPSMMHLSSFRGALHFGGLFLRNGERAQEASAIGSRQVNPRSDRHQILPAAVDQGKQK